MTRLRNHDGCCLAGARGAPSPMPMPQIAGLMPGDCRYPLDLSLQECAETYWLLLAHSFAAVNNAEGILASAHTN